MFNKVSLLFMVLFCFSIYAKDRATPKEVIEKVRQAVKLFETKGEKKALKILGLKKSNFVWKDSYIFTYNMNGTIIAHPIKPALVGKNLVNFKDIKGNLLGAVLIAAAKKPGGGWAQYYWPKPGEKKASIKASYCLKVKGKEIFVGAGVYGISAREAEAQAKE